MYVVIAGDVVDGIDIIGPFDDPDEASTWGADFSMGDWHVVKVLTPSEVEDGTEVHLTEPF